VIKISKDKKGAIKLIAFLLFVLLIPLFFIAASILDSSKANKISIAFAINESKELKQNEELLSINSENENFASALEDYKNPEFYPTYANYKNKKAPEGRIGIWGLGIYPARQERSVHAGEEFTAVAYLHASWFVQTYQGLTLKADYDSRYFDVSLSPDIVLLGPSYPSFSEEWAQKILVKVRTKDAPKGTYNIAINPTLPPFEKDEEWRASHKNYVSAAPIIPEEPYLKITVNVK